MNSRLSVTVLAGAPGTNGMRTFERLRNDMEGLRVTAIVPWQTGHDSLSQDGVSVVSTTESLQVLGRGCSCCTVRSDVMAKIRKIAEDGTADHMVLQVPPESDLHALSNTFTVADESGSILAEVAHVESLVTVIDARSFMADLETGAAPVFVERIDASRHILLEGMPSLTAEIQEEIESMITMLNPAVVIQSVDGDQFGLSTLRMGFEAQQSPQEVAAMCTWPGAST